MRSFYPSVVKFHKRSMAEVQLSYQAPVCEVNSGRSVQTKAGAVFVQAAKARSKESGGDGHTIDWDNKVSIKLSGADLAIIEDAYLEHKFTENSDVLIHHQPRDGDYSQFNVRPGKDGSFQLYVCKSSGGQKNQIVTYLSRAEMRRMMKLFDVASRTIDGWELSATVNGVVSRVAELEEQLATVKEEVLAANRFIVKELRASLKGAGAFPVTRKLAEQSDGESQAG